MKFIIIVIGILLLQRMGSLSPLQRDGWYRRWVALLRKQQWLVSMPTIRLLVSLLAPLFLLASVLLLLGNHWFGIPVFVLSFLVFLYSLGRGNLEEEIDGYRDDLKRDDLQAAYHDAAEFNVTKEVGASENWPELHDEVIGALSYRYFERYFAVIFWFVLAGAPGALLYRLLLLHSEATIAGGEENDQPQVRHGLHIMEWLPVRLMGISLAFVGNFTACLESLRVSFLSGSISTLSVIRSYVLAALASGSTTTIPEEPIEEKATVENPVEEKQATKNEAETEVAEIRALFSRALIFTLCLVAFLVILL